MKKYYLHVDLDAFFASVEILDNPNYKGKPVIVGGLPEDRRSVVSTASYEARKFGVHSAMPTTLAKKLCPNGIYIRPRMKRYHEKSQEVMNIFKEFSPDIQQISVDEAFIDLTGTEKLFGSPEETAKKIKNLVKEKTGLTVSVGLANTKYLAKIASEINKPDGFFYIPEGEEQNFMLSLPLNKIWGIGKKTLERLNSKGITTTQSIYDKSQPLLESLLGKSTGSFLYKVVRGIETNTFNTEPKNRSISAENTYPYDLTSSFIIDTALLELCHTVVFRMLNEKVRSYTVGVKIRYEDFTTVSIQETQDIDISSIDDMFSRVKRIFYKKYERNKGIRLLGVSIQNIESINNPRQKDLFDDNNEKKRKVEEAILKATQKNPKLKIIKARLLSSNELKAILFAFFCFFLNSTPYSLNNKTNEVTIDGAGSIIFDESKLPLLKENDSTSLFNYKINDTEIEFMAEGYWQSMINTNPGLKFGFDNTPTIQNNSTIFLQKVDLSLWFLLNKNWFFQANFAENFDKNTISAGYIGNGLLKEVKISNRNILFPEEYSINKLNRGIGGGDNQSPGISLNFSDERWKADIALRYDMLTSYEKNWYGKNSVSKETIELNDYYVGFQYVLPSKDAVLSIKNIYVENNSGKYNDKTGRKYKKLNSNEYILSAQKYSVFLSKDAKAYKQNGIIPTIAIEFEKNYTKLYEELGEYGTIDTPGTGFLGATQEYFSVNIEKQNSKESFFGKINGNEVLYIQHPTKFLPFAVSNRYNLSDKNVTEAIIASKSTEYPSQEYLVSITTETFKFVESDFFNPQELYAEVFIEEAILPISPKYRFPFANKIPEIYFGQENNTDISLIAKSYTSITRFDIGTNAVPGTIKVYKNGVLDTGAKYNPESGTISLSSNVNNSDHIYATWLEDNAASDNGSIASAAGIKFNITNKLTSDISFASRWSYSINRNYADLNYSSPGYATISTGLFYKDENFAFENTLGASLETQNTTNTLRILKTEEENLSFYLEKDAAKELPEGLIPVINTDEDSKINLSLFNKGIPITADGKFDSEISGYAIPISWDFTEIQNEDNLYWTALSLELPGNSSVENASNFSIKFKTENKENTDYDVYFQLGVSADIDSNFEDEETIKTWHITKLSSEEKNTSVKSYLKKDIEGWQTVTIDLKDLKLLSTAKDGRIIITSSNKTSGKIYVGTYELQNVNYKVNCKDKTTIFSYKSSSNIPKDSNIKDNFTEKKYASFFQITPQIKDTYEIYKYFEEVSFKYYEKIILWLNFEGLTQSLSITLDRPTELNTYEQAIKLVFTEEELSSLKGWQKIIINVKDKSSSHGKLEYVNKNILPTRFLLKTETSTNFTIGIGELYFSETKPYGVLEDKTSLTYENSNSIIKINNYNIIKDLKLNINNSLIKTKYEESVYTQARSSVSLFDINLQTEIATSTENKDFIDNAAHLIQTNKPIFNIFTIQENYSFNFSDETLQKNNILSLNFENYNVPIKIIGKTQATSSPWIMTQNTSLDTELNTKYLTLVGEANIQQNVISTSKDTITLQPENYFENWKDITKLSFSSGKENANLRTIQGHSNLEFYIPFIKIKPQDDFSTKGIYKSLTYYQFTTNTSQKFILPIKTQKSSFYLSWEKTIEEELTNKDFGTNYYSDFNTLTNNYNDIKWYFNSLPFQDLLTNKIQKEILNTTQASNFIDSVSYNGTYTAQWQRSFLGNKYDFFIPSNANLTVTRDITNASTLTDIYQIKFLLGFSSLNIFGKKGLIPITELYEQDEYNSSLAAAIKLPKNKTSDTKLLLTFFQQSVFYFNDFDNLKAGFEFNFEDFDNLNSKLTIIYKRAGKNSLVLTFIKLFTNNFNLKKTNLTRTDSINLFLSKSNYSNTNNTLNKQNFEYLHDLDIKLNNYATLNTRIGTSYSCTWDEYILLNVIASIGATIKF